nr:hypothetical protein [Angustibacter aerolatus]
MGDPRTGAADGRAPRRARDPLRGLRRRRLDRRRRPGGARDDRQTRCAAGVRAGRRGRRRHRPGAAGARRPAQPPGLRHPAALDRADPDDALGAPRRVAARRVVRRLDHLAGVRADHGVPGRACWRSSRPRR